MVKTYTVLLRDGTVGYVTSANAPHLGYAMTVTIQDEAGNFVKATGIIEKILKEQAPWRSPLSPFF